MVLERCYKKQDLDHDDVLGEALVLALEGLCVLQWCYDGVTFVLQCRYSVVTVVLQWCYNGVTVV
jgi:hypothetical protein